MSRPIGYVEALEQTRQGTAVVVIPLPHDRCAIGARSVLTGPLRHAAYHHDQAVRVHFTLAHMHHVHKIAEHTEP